MDGFIYTADLLHFPAIHDLVFTCKNMWKKLHCFAEANLFCQQCIFSFAIKNIDRL